MSTLMVAHILPCRALRGSRCAAPKAMTSAIFGVPASNLCGSVAPRRLLHGRRQDHVAATEEGGHRLEQLALPPEDADAGRPQHLVCREREEVAAQVRATSSRHVRHALRAVDEQTAPAACAISAISASGIDRAEHVRHVDHG